MFRLLLITMIVLVLAACSNASVPPEAYSAASATCKEHGKVMEVYATKSTVKLECVDP